MNISLCTMLNDDFVIGYECFMKSFLKHNKWFDYDLIIIDDGISEKNKEIIRSYYDKIDFRKPKKSKYENVNFAKTAKKLQPTYYKLDMFSYYDYDRIVFMDMDIVVVGNIKKLFEYKDDIGACRAYNARMDLLGDGINSGVVVINDNFINKYTYNALIKKAEKGYSMPDQKTINRFFGNKIKYIDKRYNVEKRMQHSKNYKDIYDNALCYHYVATKPWELEKPNEIEASFEKTEKIWWKYYNG